MSITTLSIPRQASPPTTDIPFFPSALTIAAGVLQLFAALAAIIDHQVFFQAEAVAHPLDTTRWGWFSLAIAVLTIGSGAGMCTRRTGAYLIGVGTASISAVQSFVFASFYPAFAFLLITVHLLVIWMLVLKVPHRIRPNGG